MDNLPPLLPRAPHGGASAEAFGGLDFSVNTNPFGPNPALLQAVQGADHAHYPDPTYLALRETLAAWHSVRTDQIAPSVGASDLLHRIARAFLPAGGKLLSLHAPFGELARAVALQRGHIQIVQDVPKTIPDGVQLVYVGQPHNPTGRSLSFAELDALAQACAAAGALLILDLAYAPFLFFSITHHPSSINLLSPGKAHGLVGARPAYAIAAPEVTERLENLAPAWHLPAGTAAVLTALPESQTYLAETLPQVAQLAAALAQALGELGPVEHHGTPYMTLEVGNAERVARQLLGHGVKVRDCTSYGFPDRIRVSTRRPAENAALVDALRAVLKAEG